MKGKSALGIFFRIPQFDKVKKRLADEIGKDAALSAYKLMLKATIENVSKLEDIEIYGIYDGKKINIDLPLVNDRRKKIRNIPLIPQRGNNLGEKMCHAIKLLFDRGYQKVSLIGTDSPDLPISYIKDAFQVLDSYELVIGPSEDGGYYLIGMNKPIGKIFKNIEWGSNKVLQDTLSRANSSGINYFLLPEWYDIDDRKTLNRWRNTGVRSSNFT